MTVAIELSGKTAKVHASQKIQPEDYEPFTARTTIEVDIDHTGDLATGTRQELKARLLKLHADAQETVERAADNRIAEQGHEDWSVPEREGSDG